MGYVIVYDDRTQTSTGCAAWEEARARVTQLLATPVAHDDVISALIAFGVFEAAVADAWCPARDEPHPILAQLRAISETLGLASAAAMQENGDDVARFARDAARTCEELNSTRWPAVRVKVPEGYAYYSLYPESYAEAVSAWAGRIQSGRVLCLGLRSIGTSLSAIVAGALRLRGIDVRSWTLRPHGDPFDRQVTLAPELVTMLEPAGRTVLIVDEGPGLSGSSMTGTAAALSKLGVPDDRIVLVPSYAPSPEQLVSRSAAARWPRHVAIIPTFDGIRHSLAIDGIVPTGASEISAGEWRTWFTLPEPWPAAQPQHERRKFVVNDTIVRFAGLGGYGHESLRRAEALADAGWTMAPGSLRRGFLASRIADGRPMRAADATEGFLRHAAGYVAWLRTHASRSETTRTDSLAEMLRVNTREALGDEWVGAAEVLAGDATAFTEPQTAIDGRLMPHEWIAAPSRWMKVDALDHHRDHFFPGCSDAAWDVAGLIAEFSASNEDPNVNSGVVDVVVAEYMRCTGDTQIAQRLPFYTAAYAAFRSGYCAMAAQTLAGTPEAARFAQLDAYYRRTLSSTLATAGAPSGR